MKTQFYGIFLAMVILTTGVQAAGNASVYDQQSWDKKVTDYTQMTGQTFEYSVSGYRIRLHFNDETTIEWERLEAPDDTAGQTGSQVIDRQNIHPGIFVMAWTEEDGSNVIDVVDIQRMQLYANFVMPDGQRFQTQAALEVVE